MSEQQKKGSLTQTTLPQQKVSPFVSMLVVVLIFVVGVELFRFAFNKSIPSVTKGRFGRLDTFIQAFALIWVFGTLLQGRCVM